MKLCPYLALVVLATACHETHNDTTNDPPPPASSGAPRPMLRLSPSTLQALARPDAALAPRDAAVPAADARAK